jgi:aminoglycoside phosphotransferase family enzyme
MLDALKNRQLAFLDRCAPALDARVQKNLIVEGHGDLRPEHVCLAAEPIFIDCLEFNRDLRIVDPADELGYLAMECEFLGAGHIGNTLFATYRACTGDAVDDSLIGFYQAHRALLRAKLAAWHLEDHLTDHGRAKWLARAREYARLAEHYCSRLPDA